MLFVICIVNDLINLLLHVLHPCLFVFSGKTYTMVGTQSDPGLMVLSLHTIFDLIKKDKSADEFEVTCSYLEVYNEVGHAILFTKLYLYYLKKKLCNILMSLNSNCIKYRLSMICLKSHPAI